MRHKNRWFLVGLTLSQAIAGRMPAQGVDSAVAWIDRLRSGEAAYVDLRVRAESTLVLVPKTTRIEEATFRRLIAATAGHAKPTRERAPGVETLVYAMGPDLDLIERRTLTRGGIKASFVKRTGKQVAGFARADWSTFLRTAADHGLLRIDVDAIGRDTLVALTFARSTPPTIAAATVPLHFSEQTSRFLRLAPDFAPTKGTGGFVILVHEPHWSVAEQFELLPGLRALQQANADRRFLFLVEGEYEGPAREIGFNGLDGVLDQSYSGSNALPLVHEMLRQYLVDGPLAYRLQYDRTVRAIAIDDLRYLGDIEGSIARPNDARVRAAVKQILDELAHSRAPLPAAQLQSVVGSVREIASALDAFDPSIKGQELVAADRRVSTSLSRFVGAVEVLRVGTASLALTEALRVLRGQERAYAADAKEFADALLRNATMIDQIIRYARGPSTELPVAFIGNFHTDGITRALRARQVGYVVIEPRMRYAPTEQERQAFDSALYTSTRSAYLSSLGSTRKLRVLPSIAEVNGRYRDYLTLKGSDLLARDKDAAGSVGEVTNSKIESDRLLSAVAENGYLSSARINVGASGIVPPRIAGGATPFAVFEPGDRKGRLTILAPEDEQWSQGARLNFLRLVPLSIPIESEEFRSAGRTSLFVDPDSHRLLVSVYDVDLKRFYFLDAGDPSVQLDVLMPLVASGRVIDSIRLLLSELLRPRRTFVGE